MALSLFCLMYLTFAEGNETFNRRVSRFVCPVMEISESGTRVPGHRSQPVCDLLLKGKRTKDHPMVIRNTTTIVIMIPEVRT